MGEFATDISRHIWETKYRYAGHGNDERVIADTWRRIAHTLAAVEPESAADWEEKFFAILQDFKFLPGGRIHAGAGTTRKVTLFNCFVMGTVEDFDPRHLPRFAGSRTHDAGGRRHRGGFLELASARYAGQRRR